MFDDAALRGFVNTLTVNTTQLNAKAAVALLAQTAAAARDRVLAEQSARAGIAPTYRQVVDGIEGAPLTTVKPDGVIVFAWSYVGEVILDTVGALIARAPQDKGDYVRSIRIIADGVFVEADAIPNNVAEVLIVPTVPYARRLEVGKKKDGTSFTAKPHIVQEIAVTAATLYRDLAAIDFVFVEIAGAQKLRAGSRSIRRRGGRVIDKVQQPAIRIRPRSA